MNGFLRHALEGWPDLWRYPEMLSLLVREPEVDASELARAVVGGMAALHTPAEVFWVLVEAGEFAAGRALIDRSAFRAALDGNSLADLQAEIQLAQVRAQQELDARVAMLRDRARVVGLPQNPPHGLDEALEIRRTQADLLLDAWKKEIEEAESERARELEERLRALIDNAPSAIKELTAWQESVRRCIEARRLDAALFLLEGGPSKPPPDEPVAVPRQMEQFWDCSPREALGQINNTLPAPRDFKARRSQPGDEEAKAIAQVLTRVVERIPDPSEVGRPLFVDAQEVEEFAETLDRFLGYTSSRPRKVLRSESGYETRLYALEDPRLPCFAHYGEAGVRLWLPSTRPENGPKAVSDDGVVLGFTLTPTPVIDRRIVFFDVFSLLRLFADPYHRRVNFLREIGAKLHPLDAVPVHGLSILLQDIGNAALRSYASWLFDILNIDVEGSELPELMVYYSGARPDLLLWLMRSLLESVGGRRLAATSERLVRVWNEINFRQAATRVLLQPLDADPAARAVLGASIFAGLQPAGRFDREDVELILGEFEEAEQMDLRVETVLKRLVGLGLLAADLTSGEYLIPRSGTGHLLVENLPDAEQFVRDSLRAARNNQDSRK